MQARQFLAQCCTTLLPLTEDVYMVDVFGIYRNHLVRIMRVPTFIEPGENSSDGLLFIRIIDLSLSFQLRERG